MYTIDYWDIEEPLLQQGMRQAVENYERGRELWDKGFLLDKDALYDLEKNSASLYLSDIQREATKCINSLYSIILNDKIAFEMAFRNHVAVAPNVGY